MALIYLDSCLLIYACEAHPLFGPLTLAAMARKQPEEQFAISPLTCMECLVKPLHSGNMGLQRYYESSFACFTWLPLHDEVFDIAAKLRARHGLRTPDALHLACALHHDCQAMWTNGDRLTAAGHGFVSNVLKADRD